MEQAGREVKRDVKFYYDSSDPSGLDASEIRGEVDQKLRRWGV